MRPLTAVTIAISCLVALPALAAGDAQAGRALTERWCSGCHLVDGGSRGVDAAPPFGAIAQRNPRDQSWVRAWLAAPHPPMPDLNLSRQQIDDIVAYLGSLAPPTR